MNSASPAEISSFKRKCREALRVFKRNEEMELSLISEKIRTTQLSIRYLNKCLSGQIEDLDFDVISRASIERRQRIRIRYLSILKYKYNQLI